MQSMPAAVTAVTVGVDTHLDQHVAAVIDQAGRLCGTQAFAASTRGYVALVTWAERFGPVECIGIEGTGTYGAGLARFARAYGLQVVEVDRPDRSTRRRRGKSDPIDAQAAARATLAGVAATTPKTRDGQVEMIRVLRVARRGALKARVAAAEQLHGVLYSAPEELRAPLLGLKTKALVRLCAAMRPGPLTSPSAATKASLRTLARRWQQLQAKAPATIRTSGLLRHSTMRRAWAAMRRMSAAKHALPVRIGLTRWLATPRGRDQHSTERRQTRGHCRRSTHSGRPPSFDRTPREIGSAGFEPSVTVSSDPS